MLGDAKRIRQVLVNLVGNAIKYTATGGVTVAVTSERRNPRVTNIRIAVTDTGPGIPEDRIESIFDKYSRIDDERGALAAGTGLGLPITRTLVNAMGGTISVRSELGRGSTFTVELPLTIALSTAKIRESEVIERDADRVRLERPLRVLVVDDVQTNLLVARGLLERIGREVIPADDGVEALMRLDEQAIDLVFMDCLMPGLDGYETTRRIRAHARAEVRGLPVIALTAGVMAEERQRCLDAGMDDILAKPITPGALREVLTRNTRRPALAPAPGSSAEAS